MSCQRPETNPPSANGILSTMQAIPFSKISNTPIRSRLFRDLVLIILLTACLLILVSWLLIGALKRDLASVRITDAAQLVRDEVQNLLLPVEQQLLIARDGLIADGAVPGDRSVLDVRFMPTLRHMEQIAGAIYADAGGSEYFLLRATDGWLVRQRASGASGTGTWNQLDDAGSVQDTREGPLDYDPRQRPWYQAALASEGERVSWSAPYIFHSSQVPGVTVSLTWQVEGDTRVLAFDIVLSRILDAIGRLPLGTDGKGFLFSSEGGVFMSSSEENGDRLHARHRFFSAHERLGGPLFIDAVAAWRDAGGPSDDLIQFSSGGRSWWGGFRPLTEHARTAWVGVAIPVSATTGILQSRWHILALNTLVIVGLGIGLAAILMRKYSRQLRDLPKLAIDRQDYANDLYDLIANGEDTHIEFKSTMRTNLHTSKPGKEIELAWLKAVAAFMNTEGGILLIGVADDACILGLEADKFENDDKCRLHFKNLLNQHLGAEYTRHLRFELYELDGKQIAAVECERADTPVFLRNKNTESFLIRNGPSNIELSLSRALKYIRGRF